MRITEAATCCSGSGSADAAAAAEQEAKITAAIPEIFAALPNRPKPRTWFELAVGFDAGKKEVGSLIVGAAARACSAPGIPARNNSASALLGAGTAPKPIARILIATLVSARMVSPGCIDASSDVSVGRSNASMKLLTAISRSPS